MSVSRIVTKNLNVECTECDVAMDFLEYPDVSSEIRGAMVNGKLKMTDSKIVFKGDKSGSKNEVDANQIEMVSWQRMAGTWGVRVFTKDGGLQRFAGFKEAVSAQCFHISRRLP